MRSLSNGLRNISMTSTVGVCAVICIPTAGKIQDLRGRLDEAVHADGQRVQSKSSTPKEEMTARERIAKLV